MTHDTNYRTRANAVFFAAVMVLSMVAVGFAAAPAAAQYESYDDTNDLIGELVWQEQIVQVGGLDADTDVTLRESTDGGSSFVTELNTDGDGDVEIDTEDLDAGDYFIEGGGSDMSEDDTFEIAVQSLSTEFEEDSAQADETVGLDVDSNRGSYSLAVSADGDLDDDELERLFEDSGVDTDAGDEDDDDEIVLEDVSDGTVDVDFDAVDDLSAGEYEFAFESTDTSAEDTASIEVTEAGEGDLGLADGSTEVAQGDVANVTVELDETDEGTVVIGDYEEDNYQANVSVEDGDDDGEVSVLFNTYTAGRDGTVVRAADDEDDVSLGGERGDLSDLLDTGDYDVSVSPTAIEDGSAEAALDDETDIGTLLVEERETGEMVLWRTTGDVRDDVAEARDDDGDDAATDAIVGGLESDAVTETDEVAVGDTSDVLVHQISATGLEGALDAQDADGNSEALYRVLNSSAEYDGEDVDALRLTFTEEDPGSNAGANEIDATALSEDQFAAATTVVYDDENGDYYVFLDLDALNGVLEETDDVDAIEDGDEYTAEFTVQEPLLTAAEDDDDFEDIEDAYESANATFEAVEADGEFDADEVEVEAAENQSIAGTTNVAPGTELDMRVRSDDAETSFIKNDEGLNVTANGTFEGSFDFSDQVANDTFTVDVRNAPFDASTEGTVTGAGNDTDDTEGGFEVSDLDPEEATIAAGDALTVSATIENAGEEEATQDVALTLDGDELDTEEVTLEGGEDTTVEFSDVDTSDLEPGEYEHGVATDDDEQTGTLTVEGDDGGDGSDGNDSDGDDGDDGDGMDGDDGDDGGSEDGVPGFGALVALVALVAAALLATRRTE